MTTGRRFARFATTAVVRRPWLWRLFRGQLRRQFDTLAPEWDTRRASAGYGAYEAALDAVDPPPATALDLGTGTGDGAQLIARLFPGAAVTGVDLAPEMIEAARGKLPADLAERVGFEVADASRLPYADGAFELVGLSNMIPFFDELARVTADRGAVVFAFARGPGTPIYVPPETLRAELAARGFTDFEDIDSPPGTGLVARKHSAG